jgi:hypothetical protein
MSYLAAWVVLVEKLRIAGHVESESVPGCSLPAFVDDLAHETCEGRDKFRVIDFAPSEGALLVTGSNGLPGEWWDPVENAGEEDTWEVDIVTAYGKGCELRISEGWPVPC